MITKTSSKIEIEMAKRESLPPLPNSSHEFSEALMPN
jgi:hypothetical protein